MVKHDQKKSTNAYIQRQREHQIFVLSSARANDMGFTEATPVFEGLKSVDKMKPPSRIPPFRCSSAS
jgi:hypothetical protein